MEADDTFPAPGGGLVSPGALQPSSFPASSSAFFAKHEDVESTTSTVELAPSHLPSGLSHMLCCLCGLSIPPNPTRMCVECLRGQVDLSEGVSKSLILPWCRQCGRYLFQRWLSCKAESPELLALCLKKIRGLKKTVRPVEAKFIWTEPHSKRIKLRLTVQSEVMQGAMLQQTFTLTFILHYQQCDDCKRVYTPHTWKATVQVRQRAEHRRSFLYLEQLILKHQAHEQILNVVQVQDGLDFFFDSKQAALRFCDFTSSHFPTRTKVSKQMIGHDTNSNFFRNKHSVYLELCPVCKEDLVCLPKKQMQIAHGGSSGVLLCKRIAKNIVLIDPFTGIQLDIPGERYWRRQLRWTWSS
eukprot:GHVT01055130.1.p1 GENE.GHVT01055130.1~~GHVT01055130.1.p1  ORF type:complete len:355 (-),score=50.78 GHVT01055130.1:582-1646(-)